MAFTVDDGEGSLVKLTMTMDGAYQATSQKPNTQPPGRGGRSWICWATWKAINPHISNARASVWGPQRFFDAICQE